MGVFVRKAALMPLQGNTQLQHRHCNIQTAQDSMVLDNSVGLVKVTPKGTSPVCSVKQQENSVGGSLSVNPPSRQVLYTNILEPSIQNDDSSFISDCVDNTAEATDYGIGEVYENVGQGRESIEIGIMEQDKRVQGEEQGTNQGGGNIPPLREVLSHSTVSEEMKETDDLLVAASEYMVSTQEDQWSVEITHTCQAEFPRVEHRDFSGGNGEPPSRGVPNHLVNDDMTSPANTPNSILPAAKAPDTSLEDAIFT